ncbi:MAG TPA: PspC domain-containing protein [Candidatus Limnocylindrales bacterium]|jgi:phage shock protein C
MNGRLYRHPTDKVIGGVAAGIGAWMGIDPTIVRIAWVLLAIFTSGVFLVIYVVMLFVVPLAPAGWTPPEGRPLAGGGPGWGQPGGQTGVPPGWSQAGTNPPGAGSGGWQAPGGGWSPDTGVGGNAGIIAGVILIALGAWFLVDRYLELDWSLLWPVMLMLGGIGIIVAVSRRTGPPG